MATRLNNNLPTLYQEFIHLSRYSRWLEDKGRRETWGETIDRYFNFFEEHLLEMHNYKLEPKLRNKLEEAVQTGYEILKNSKINISRQIHLIWETMFNCIERGLTINSVLPGELKVSRRAPNLYKSLLDEGGLNNVNVMDWVNVLLKMIE